MPDHIVIYKTGRLHELELACNALKESGIPHFKQQESSSGLKLAMPFAPSMGPGTFWNVLVPKSEKSVAEKLLSELPIDFTTHPSVWQFDSNSQQKRNLKAIIIAGLLSFGLILAYNLFELLKK